MIDYFSALNNNGSKDVPDYKSEVHGGRSIQNTKRYKVLITFKGTPDYMKIYTKSSVIPQFTNTSKDFVIIQDSDGCNLLINTREVLVIKQEEE